MIRAFLSHTSSDKDLVGLVHERLVLGNAWYDSADIENGDSIPDKISEGLRNATHYVLFWSKRAKNSPWVKAELNAAFIRFLASKCKLLIFALDDTELPELLQHYCFDRIDKTDLINAADKVVSTILSQEGSEPKLSEFVNRTKEIGDIEEAARNGYKLIILYGILGVGKASLANKALHWLYLNRASTIISINFDMIPGMAELALELSRKTGQSLINDNLNLESQKENIRYFLEIISQNKKLIILENIKNWLDEDGMLTDNLKYVTDIIVSTRLFDGVTIATSSRYVEVPYEYYQVSRQIQVRGMDDLHIAEIINNNLPASFPSCKEKNIEFAKRLYGYPLGAKLGAYRISNHGYDYFLRQPVKIESLKINLAKQLISYSGITSDCQEYLKILALSQSRLTNEEYSVAFPQLADKIGNLADEAFFAGVIEFGEDGCYKLETLVRDYFYRQALCAENREEICQALESYLMQELQNTTQSKYLRLLPAAVHVLTFNGKMNIAISLRAEMTATIARTMWDQYNNTNYEEAMKTAEGLLSINEENSEALYVKALCLTRNDEFELAVKILNQLLENHEENAAQYYYALGRVEERKGEYNGAIEWFELAALKKKKYLSPHREMAKCYLHCNDFSNAWKEIQKAKKIDDSNIYVILIEAHLLQKQGDAEKAIELLSEQSLLDQNSSQLLFRKGRAFDQLGKISEAKQCYEEALKYDSQMEDARLCLLNHKIMDDPTSVEAEISGHKLRLKGKRRAILANIEAKYIGYVKHDEENALNILDAVKQKYRDKQWYAVRIQLLENLIEKNLQADRGIVAKQLTKDRDNMKNEFENKYGTVAVSSVDLLPDM